MGLQEGFEIIITGFQLGYWLSNSWDGFLEHTLFPGFQALFPPFSGGKKFFHVTPLWGKTPSRNRGPQGVKTLGWEKTRGNRGDILGEARLFKEPGTFQSVNMFFFSF